ncbi:hypothetical protein [Candidatus Cyanaurora vandensis]|uniref:hypothetical protein n=1 Tax=Candidatus Cyanaurora vandensis TaxID=2714958 RepID=UPI00257AC1E5|nr:hypothetical protein [Candidatus Cyanaurora vandensis]
MTPDTVGILPPGALGVAFFYQLTRELTELERVFFLSRRGSASAQGLQALGLTLKTAQGLRQIDGSLLKPDLLALESLPEVLLVCPNPDQLLEVMTDLVEVLIKLYRQGRDWTALPLVVLSANGIYYQRVRQVLIEKLEEGTLFGRLPDLWPEAMPQMVGRLLRGVTLQTGLREGSGSQTVYVPGPPGPTKLAGGELRHRERASALLNKLGGWFEVEQERSATRLEFDKALVNLAANLLGQVYAIDETGRFTLLRVKEIVVPAHLEEVRELVYRVFAVGQAVNAYPPTEDREVIFQNLLLNCKRHADHIPSSLQWVNLNLYRGTLAPELTPTEAWLLEPLRRYALAGGLEETALYFEQLKARLVHKLTLAAARQVPVSP